MTDGGRILCWQLRMLALALCALASSGCAQIRLPAIDPTGERIFLPSPYSTTLENPLVGTAQCPGFFQPAWTSPPPVPPCADAFPVTPFAITPPLAVAPPVIATPAPPRTKHPHLLQTGHHREQLGHITLTPTKVIAPVGGEVVLVAGLCDPQGMLVVGEKVRWILTNNSVGHFVEVADDQRSHALFQAREARLHSGNFAEGRTSSKRQVITRGTPSTLDDVTLLAGQAWISITSPIEGVSHATVIAPDAAIWSDRRQTATIHWIDAQWVFPQPAVVQAGSTAELVTIVTRTSGEAPPPNYMVRYELAGDSPARFPGGQTAVDVPVDGGGRAAISLVSPPGQPGVSQVRVQVIRGDADGSRLILAESWTSVAWSAPALDIAITGPSVGSAGAALVYRVQVTNPGDVVARDVAVGVELPNGLKFVSSSPTAQAFGNRIEWRLGDLPGRGRADLELIVRADFAQAFRLTARAVGAVGLQAQASVDTQIFEPSLEVRMEGPETAVVGDRVQYRVRITNTGQYPLPHVILRDRFDEGLQHSEGQPSPIERDLGTIQPGEERPVAVTFIVRRPGRWCHVLEVQADGQTKSVQACLVASEPPAVTPAVEVRKTGPRQARVGENVQFVIDVTNTGDAVLSNVQIADVLDAAFNPIGATDGFDMRQLPQGRLVWTIAQLAPGQRAPTITVECVCTQVSAAAVNRVTVTADPGISESAETRTEILPAAPAQPPPATRPRPEAGVETRPAPVPAAPADGQLRIAITDDKDPALVNDTITYTISVTNARNVEDRNVRLRIELPDGLRFQRISRGAVGVSDAVPLQPRFSPDGKVVELPEIQTVRAGETLPPFLLQVVAERAGRYTVRADATSLRTTTAAEAAEQTAVFPR